ncbi:MAG TPA: response regulator, partial [bacterium]|nr:response regulator [bacterium]
MAETKKTRSKLLLVDADEQARLLIKENLIKEDYIVFDTGNGNVALEIVNREKPDLVISDIFLGEMNGFELC